VDSTGVLKFRLVNLSSGIAEAQSSGFYTNHLGKWVLVTGTYDGSISRLYLNGEQAGSASISGPINDYAGRFKLEDMRQLEEICGV
jgi:hypothetical protein